MHIGTLLTAQDRSGETLDWEADAQWSMEVETQRNPFFEGVPGDLPNFDFAELETEGANIFFIDDHWVCDSGAIGSPLAKIADLSDAQQQIGAWWKSLPQN